MANSTITPTSTPSSRHSTPNHTYRGRFAPSPTGPLHFGSLFAAVVSNLDALAHQGEWFVRIEDLDPPREQVGAIEKILHTLETHKLYSDLPIRYQSTQHLRYEALLKQLAESKLIYPCACSRRELQEFGGHSPQCLKIQADIDAGQTFEFEQKEPCALRFKSNNKCYEWIDRFQGPQSSTLNEDFVLKRKDGLYAYQLAVVADDIDQGVSHVVRGIDLIDSTPMQLALYDALDHTPPVYAHFPVISNVQGQKLSKQNRSRAIDDSAVANNLNEIYQRLINKERSDNYAHLQELSALCSELLSHWPPLVLTQADNLPSPDNYSGVE